MIVLVFILISALKYCFFFHIKIFLKKRRTKLFLDKKKKTKKVFSENF